MGSYYIIWPWKYLLKNSSVFGAEMNSSGLTDLEISRFWNLGAVILNIDIPGSHNIRKKLFLYFWNRERISFHIQCNMTPCGSFYKFGLLGSYYKIWPQKILSRMVKKSKSYHIQRLGNRQFKIQPVFSGISDIRFAKKASCRRVSKPFLSRSFEIFEIGWSISEKNSCKKPFRWKKNTPL